MRGLSESGFAEDDHLVAHGEVLLHERQVPPAAMQPRRAVVEDKLEDGFGVVIEPLDAEGDDVAARGGRLIELQFGDGPEVAAVFVAAAAGAAAGPRRCGCPAGPTAPRVPGRRRTRRRPAGRGAAVGAWAARRSSAGILRGRRRNPKQEIRVRPLQCDARDWKKTRKYILLCGAIRASFAWNLEQEKDFEGVVSDLGFCLAGDCDRGLMRATVSGGAVLSFTQGPPQTQRGA